MYRKSRNIEASLIDFITAELSVDGWTGINVSKGFPQDYKGKLPMIGIEALELRPQKLEIGSKRNLKYFTVKIRIIAKNDGQRLDLADWLFDELEEDIDFYEYVITSGQVSTKTLTGRLVITKWFENRKELQNTEVLESEDRYRHVFIFEVIVAK